MDSESFDPLVRVRDLLLLKMLRSGEINGHNLRRSLSAVSQGHFGMAPASLYKALQRLEDRDLVRSEARRLPNNSRTRLYSLTTAGERQLEAEWETWKRFTDMVAEILHAPAGPSQTSPAPIEIQMDTVRPLLPAALAG